MSMLNSQFLRNLNNNLTRTEKLQDQLASGKLISKPSDDPVGITFAMRYRSEVASNEQHLRNVDAATSFLDNVDSALEHSTQVMQRIRELTVQADNATNSKASRDAIAAEIEQQLQELVNIGNTQFNGKYVFNGQLTDQAPYPLTVNPETVNTDEGAMLYEVGIGIKMQVNVTGSDIYGKSTDADNTFKNIKELITAIRDGNSPGMNTALSRIDSRMDKFLAIRSDVGARMNRMEFIQGRLKEVDKNLQELQSKIEDANMAELITVMKTNESVYQASLATGAKIITPTLIDFLR
jgi:flagellar hook-associated protein 3 FlgL